MTRKPLPIEAIVGLYQQIAGLSAKHRLFESLRGKAKNGIRI